jgi:hypothetical protein
VPTVRGPIRINATATTVYVTVPCNTMATLCIAAPAEATRRAVARYELDGHAIVAEILRVDGTHACVATVGCGVAGAPRKLACVDDTVSQNANSKTV